LAGFQKHDYTVAGRNILNGNKIKLFVSVGEPSGDERAAELILELRKLIPGLQVIGMGGEALRNVGVETIIDIRDTAVFGLAEALASLGKFKRIKREILSVWHRERPDAALLVDFGGFNLRLARSLKRRNAPVVYYISPQLWASRKGRIRFVRKYVDLMMVVLPFENEFYRRYGVKTFYTGHPLIGKIESRFGREEVCARLGIDGGGPIIGMMPGSRDSEIERLLPIILDAAAGLRNRGYDRQLLVAAPGKAEMLKNRLGGLPIPIAASERYSAMAACDLLIIASGTAALEAAVLHRPAVVIYRSSALTALAAKLLLRVKHVSLPNIIHGSAVYPELLQKACRPERIIEETLKILEDKERYDRIRAQVKRVIDSLGGPGAAARAADQLASFLAERLDHG
jgi:lipid-A-disaccharide synthase